MTALLALKLAAFSCEVEGMKWENQFRVMNGDSPLYGSTEFYQLQKSTLEQINSLDLKE